MKFCANPKCLFHIDLPRQREVHTIILPQPVQDLSEPVSKSVPTITREKHLWTNGHKAGISDWFFCDVCDEAGGMVKRAFN